MSRVCSVVVLFLVLVYSSSGVVVDVSVDTDVKISSGYAWRGRVWNDEPVFQPALTVGIGDLDLIAKGIWDLTDANNSADHTRADLSIDYNFMHGKQLIRPGIIGYVYYDAKEKGRSDTFEVFVDYAIDVVLLPRLVLYYDFADVDSIYAEFSLAHSFELVKDRLAADIRTSVAYGDANLNENLFSLPANDSVSAYTPSGSLFVNYTASLSFPFTLSDTCIFTPEIKYSSIIDSDTRNALDDYGEDSDIVIYSVNLGMYF